MTNPWQRVPPGAPEERKEPMTIIWEEPPNAQHGRPSKYENVLEELANRPGEWARFAEFKTARGASGLAARLRKKYPGYDFTSRGTYVYGVYTGATD